MGVHDVDYKKVKKLLGVPDEMPIFILVGKDKLAYPAITRYTNAARGIEGAQHPSAEWFENMVGVEEDFARYAVEFPDTMKIPD